MVWSTKQRKNRQNELKIDVLFFIRLLYSVTCQQSTIFISLSCRNSIFGSSSHCLLLNIYTLYIIYMYTPCRQFPFLFSVLVVQYKKYSILPESSCVLPVKFTSAALLVGGRHMYVLRAHFRVSHRMCLIEA